MPSKRHRHGNSPRRTQDLLLSEPTKHATRMANLTEFQRNQTFGLCTGSELGPCDRGLDGSSVLLTPYNGQTTLDKDQVTLRHTGGHRCYRCNVKLHKHKRATDERYHLTVQYKHMGFHQGESTAQCRSLMEVLVSDQPKCCYCDVTLVNLSSQFASSSPERLYESVRSYLSSQQTVKRCCLMDQFGLKGHTPEEKYSFHPIARVPIATGKWNPQILHTEGIDETCNALQRLDEDPMAPGLPPGVTPPSNTQASGWRGKLMSKIRIRMRPHDEVPDFDCTYLTTLLARQRNRCVKYGAKGVQASNSLWSLSLDRIDSDRWYYKDNIIFVLKAANLGKNSRNDNEFCQHLYNLHATV
jgi:hypothetical protein